MNDGNWPHEFRNVDGAIGLVGEMIIGFLKLIWTLSGIYTSRVV
jgi:hypothetical protein